MIKDYFLKHFVKCAKFRDWLVAFFTSAILLFLKMGDTYADFKIRGTVQSVRERSRFNERGKARLCAHLF